MYGHRSEMASCCLREDVEAAGDVLPLLLGIATVLKCSWQFLWDECLDADYWKVLDTIREFLECKVPNTKTSHIVAYMDAGLLR